MTLPTMPSVRGCVSATRLFQYLVGLHAFGDVAHHAQHVWFAAQHHGRSARFHVKGTAVFAHVHRLSVERLPREDDIQVILENRPVILVDKLEAGSA